MMKKFKKIQKNCFNVCCALTIFFSNAQQLKWVLPSYQWDMQSTALSNSSLPGSSSSTYLLSNGAYDASGNLLFYVQDDNIANASGVSIGSLLPYYDHGYKYLHDGYGGEYEHNYETSGEEVAIVPVPGACKKFYVIYTKGNWVSTGSILLYAIVDCSSGSATVSFPLANNPGVSNGPVNAAIGDGSYGHGIAVSKTYNGSDRYLFFGGQFGISRYTITSSGISSGIIICNGSDEPTLFNVGGGQASNPELELSPDQQYLAWANTSKGRLCIVKLNNSYTKVTGAAVAETLSNIKGVEFNATSTRIYVSEPIKGIQYYTIGSSGFTYFTNALDLDNSFLELAKNGRIYGVNSSHRLRSINESTSSLNSVEASPDVNSDGFHVFGFTGRHHLPDQIDGEDYSNISGDATPAANFAINGNPASTDCNNPTEFFKCSNSIMTLNNYCTNSSAYQVVVKKIGACFTRGTLVHDTGILANCPIDLKNLPGGASGTYLANNVGLYRVSLVSYNNCGIASTITIYVQISNAPSGATASFSTDVITKPGQTLTIGACVVPSNTGLSYTNGATSCGGVGGYSFPMEHSSVLTPNEIGRLNTTFNLSTVSAGIGSSTYQVNLKTDQWNGSSWVSMDSNPTGETIIGASTLSLIGLVAYDPLSPWYEAFTNSSLTPDGSIYKITVTVSNECGDYTSVQIVKLNTIKLKSLSAGNLLETTQNNSNVYPNPTDGRLTFDFSSETETEVIISITSVDGKIVKKSINSSIIGYNQVALDLSEFDSGTYLYSLKFDDNITTGTIIKK